MTSPIRSTLGTPQRLLLLGVGAMLGGGTAWLAKPDSASSPAVAPAAAVATVTTVASTSTTIGAPASTSIVVDSPSTPAPASAPPAGQPVSTVPTAAVPPVAPSAPPTAAPQAAPVTTPTVTTLPTPVATGPTLPPAIPGVEGPHLPGDPALTGLATFAEGTLTIVGAVPDQATADLVVQRATAFLPASTVTHGLTATPGAPAPLPLFILSSDEVFAEATIRLEFAPSIIAMASQLQAFPGTTVDFYVHTDATAGSESAALELTTRQAEALRAIFIAQGIDNARIHVFPKGSTEPLGLLGAGQPGADRRLEVVVAGLYS